MDLDNQISIVFNSVEWDHFAGPSAFCLPIRQTFLVDSEGILPSSDMEDVLYSYLQDEFNAQPKSFSFYINGVS